MKKAKLIYNPYSGDRSFRYKLDTVIDKLQSGGYEITLHRTSSIEDIYENIEMSNDYDAILVSGGDGTINHVINAMIKNNIDVPVGIFPFGTANDFAGHLGITKKISQACNVIINGNIKELNLGKANDRYFVNVAAAGLLTDVSQKIDINMKNTLGKMAYYLKGIEQLPNFRAIPIKITQGDLIITDNVYLFVVLNGSTAGGFELAPGSTADDGNLSFVAIKACNVVELFNLFFKMLKGEHLGSNSVIYLKGSSFKIECTSGLEIDLDGENGPEFPLSVRISNKKLKVFTP